MERKWLAIGQIAKRSGVKASALRFYEQKGLIQSLRSEGGRRLYPQDALRRIAFIRVAQGMGLSLDEIAGLLEVKGQRACEQTRQLTEQKLAEVRRRLDELRQLEVDLEHLGYKVSHITKIGTL